MGQLSERREFFGFWDSRGRVALGFLLNMILRRQKSGLPQEKITFGAHPPIVYIQHQKNPVTGGGDSRGKFRRAEGPLGGGGGRKGKFRGKLEALKKRTICVCSPRGGRGYSVDCTE